MNLEEIKLEFKNKLNSYEKGLWAEKFAKQYFAMLGYEVAEERFKTEFGEIDLILRRKNSIVFAEVKFRQSIDLALESIHQRNQNRVFKAAKLYLAQNPQYNDFELRFDALALAPYCVPRHIENAW